MQNVGVSDDELRSLVSFVLFNIFVGLLGYNIWNLFPRGPPNERVQRISKLLRSIQGTVTLTPVPLGYSRIPHNVIIVRIQVIELLFVCLSNENCPQSQLTFYGNKSNFDAEALRPCFERYPNHRLVNLKPYHSEWRMRTEEMCLMFCSDTRSRCRSIVYDSVQHICHFFLDGGEDFAIPAAKMIYLRVTSKDCIDQIIEPRPPANTVESVSQEQSSAELSAEVPSPGMFNIPRTPTVFGEVHVPATKPPTKPSTTAATTTPSTTTPSLSASASLELSDENTAENFDEEMEKVKVRNDLLRDINGIENVESRWQTSMEKLVKNNDHLALKGARIPLVKLLERKYPAKFAQYLVEKERLIGSLRSDEEVPPRPMKAHQPTRKRTEFFGRRISFSDDHMYSRKAEGADIRRQSPKPLKKFFGRRISFSDDHMYSRKAEGADIRRQSPKPLKQVPLLETSTPSFVKKARSFLQMVNARKSQSKSVEEPSTAQLDSTANVFPTAGCSEGDVAIWMDFENTVGSEVIDSTFVENWNDCRKICGEEHCHSFTYYDDKQCVINIEDEGVNLRPPQQLDYSARTTLKFCYPNNLSPYHGCSNFVAFRDYALAKEPREQFDGLPAGYDGMKLCVELCVLSSDYACRVSDHERSRTIERVAMKEKPSSMKALKIKPLKLKSPRRRTLSTGFVTE
ncbi:unnamed protein product [Nippostrongylus brasiliensis]|uniref:Apple domain-containing protein n=1 Tax=Nippostrongylus brasiliensis TaxID=27835 RepID=A0A158R099_NIPBR|nr:unnamed protein product [Nippostrongylus brasiliensis]